MTWNRQIPAWLLFCDILVVNHDGTRYNVSSILNVILLDLFMKGPLLQGLQYIADTIQFRNTEKTKVKALLQNYVDVAYKTNGPKEPTKIHRSFTTRISSNRSCDEDF